ncbi:MAG: MotA/TolQ/ExbB proton channel family protein [Desulfuromonas thiophila]|nr:MotA/TolQ/ExbB proton channel family protein [Desulfuromonas thiophila]
MSYGDKKRIGGVLGLLLLVPVLAAAAETAGTAVVDVRAVYQQLNRQQQQSAAELADARGRIGHNRAELEQQAERLRQTNVGLRRQLQEQEEQLAQLQRQASQLREGRRQEEQAQRQILAALRTGAGQLEELLQASPLYQPLPPALLDSTAVPALADLRQLEDLYFRLMEDGSTVSLMTRAYIDGRGEKRQGPVLRLGPFLTLAQTAEGLRLLQPDAASGRLRVSAARPDGRLRRQLQRYLEGESAAVPLDLTQGAALQHLSRQKGFLARLQEGGILVWPIVLLALVAALIGIERALFLKRVHDNTDRTMTAVNRNAAAGDWEACQQLVNGRSTPVYNVVRAGLEARHEQREVLESVLQEAILKELPRLERALPLLGIMAAVAPLLGLLGTVTGMIDTFEVINIHGSGDPKLLSGGISVALVTTMLGLMVAIPIMLLHTVLGRQVEHIIGDMEEKSVTLINIIQRCGLGGCGVARD